MFYYLMIHSPWPQSCPIQARPWIFGSLMYRSCLCSARILQDGVSRSGTFRRLGSWARTSRYCKSVYQLDEWTVCAFEADRGSYDLFHTRHTHLWNLPLQASLTRSFAPPPHSPFYDGGGRQSSTDPHCEGKVQNKCFNLIARPTLSRKLSKQP